MYGANGSSNKKIILQFAFNILSLIDLKYEYNIMKNTVFGDKQHHHRRHTPSQPWKITQKKKLLISWQTSAHAFQIYHFEIYILIYHIRIIRRFKDGCVVLWDELSLSIYAMFGATIYRRKKHQIEYTESKSSECESELTDYLAYTERRARMAPKRKKKEKYEL